MLISKQTLITMKAALINARSLVQDSASRARRGGDFDLAERLRDIAERLADELDYIDRCIAKQP